MAARCPKLTRALQSLSVIQDERGKLMSTGPLSNIQNVKENLDRF
jgi:hypothetical protein